VVTYFFSTSGGRTESVENTSLGSRPLPWLKSVSDPYDKVSPRHRWGPITMTVARADRKLGNLVPGFLRGIEVVKRGVSPRVVAADVVGSRGRTRVTGAQLRARLGLLDTGRTSRRSRPRKKRPRPPDEEGDPAAPTGGVDPRSAGSRSPAGRWRGVWSARSAGAPRWSRSASGRAGGVPARRGSGAWLLPLRALRPRARTACASARPPGPSCGTSAGVDARQRLGDARRASLRPRSGR
jgi:stage II sporulation protein D